MLLETHRWISIAIWQLIVKKKALAKGGSDTKLGKLPWLPLAMGDLKTSHVLSVSNTLGW